MPKFMIAAAATIAAAGTLASSAAADSPDREPVEAGSFTVYTCGFPVQASVFANREQITTFSDGRVRITGQIKVELSANGQTLVINASGPGILNPDKDEFYSHGIGVLDVATPTGVTLAQVAGTVDNETGQVLEGHIIRDLCQELGA
jgi:hypothetical protein